jgi:hypothetical protein
MKYLRLSGVLFLARKGTSGPWFQKVPNSVPGQQQQKGKFSLVLQGFSTLKCQLLHLTYYL